MSQPPTPFIRKVGRLIADGDIETIGEAAVKAGLITPEQMLECERHAAAHPERAFRSILEERCGLSAAALDGLAPVPEILAGRYQLEKVVGEGGTSVVYLSWDRQLQRRVAVKKLRGDRQLNPTMIKRMKQEAQAVARLNHPNLVGLHDFIEVAGQPHLIMEFFEGRSLADEIKSRNLSLSRAVETLEKVARAVHHAHLNGVIHRDLKPGNIQFDRQGEPHVLDFGLAHLYGGEEGLTRTGASLGTPYYMSPEQVRGEKDAIDERTDVYGLGATFYEAITGRPPFDDATPAGIFNGILNEDPSLPRSVNPRIHAELEAIALKALAKRPSSRYPTALEFAEDLRRHRQGEPVIARPAGFGAKAARFVRRHRIASAVGGALTVMVLSLLLVFGIRSALRTAEIRRMVEEADGKYDQRDWEKAEARYGEAQKLDSRDPRIQARRVVAREMARAVMLRNRIVLAREDLARVKSTAPGSLSDQLARDDASQDLERKIGADEMALEVTLLGVAMLARDVSQSRILLTQIYKDRFADAEGRNDRTRMEWCISQILAYGSEEDRKSLTQPRPVKIACTPEGAAAFLFRYEKRQRRLIPVPCSAKGELERGLELVSIEPLRLADPEPEKERVRNGSAYPLVASAFNRVPIETGIVLPPGSYVILFQKAGFAEGRYPFVIGSDAGISGEVALLPDIPRGFVHVPGGPFISGGDPVLFSRDRRPREKSASRTESFILGRYPVTWAEYEEYMKAVGKSPAEFQEAVRIKQGTSRDFKPAEPAFGMTHLEAEKYCAWLTSRIGNPGWTFRLPTEDEWEKGARGVDGRYFPWGDEDIAGFCVNSDSFPLGRGDMVPMGRGLCPADESTFGVRDSAGLVSNWTSTVTGTGSNLRITIKGGSRIYVSTACRPSYQSYSSPHSSSFALGFRVAASVK